MKSINSQSDQILEVYAQMLVADNVLVTHTNFCWLVTHLWPLTVRYHV